MKESEKQLIVSDGNKSCFKLLCVSHLKHQTLMTVMIIIFVLISTLLALFGSILINQAYYSQQHPKVTINAVESLSSDHLSAQFSCRSKRSVNNEIPRQLTIDSDEDEFRDREHDFLKSDSSNLIKRDAKIADDDEIGQFLDQKYHEVNLVRPRHENLQNSIEKFEKTLENSENFLQNLNSNEIDDETSNLIQKNLHDLSAEMKAIDDDIISLLETSNLIDNSIHKRIRHKRNVGNRIEIDTLNFDRTPILEEKKREKRLIQQKLEEVREEFIRCKKSNSDDCDEIYSRVMKRFKEITRKFKEIEDIMKDMDVVAIDKKPVERSDENESDEKKDKKKKKKPKKSSEEKNSSEEKPKTSNEHQADEKTTTEKIEEDEETTTENTTTKNEKSEDEKVGDQNEEEIEENADNELTETRDEPESDQDLGQEHLITQPESLYDTDHEKDEELPLIGEELSAEHEELSSEHEEHLELPKKKTTKVIAKDHDKKLHKNKEKDTKNIKKDHKDNKKDHKDNKKDHKDNKKDHKDNKKDHKDNKEDHKDHNKHIDVKKDGKKKGYTKVHHKSSEEEEVGIVNEDSKEKADIISSKLKSPTISKLPLDPEQITACPASAFDSSVNKPPKFVDELQDDRYLSTKLYDHEPSFEKKIDRKITGNDILDGVAHLLHDIIDDGIQTISSNTRSELDNRQAQPNFTPMQFSGFANAPVVYPTTGETMKATSKVIMNPGYSLMPYPVCFVNYHQQYRPVQPYFYPQMMPMPMMHTQPGGNDHSGSLIPPEFVRQNGMFMPTGGQFMAQRPAPIQPMMQNIQGYPNYRESMGQPTFCAFMPTDNAQFPAYYEQTTTAAPTSGKPSGSWDRKKADSDGKEERNHNPNPYNIPSQYDVIYATYPSQILNMNQSTHHNCEPGKLPCFSTNQCILKSKWCDSKVDCVDASDETACSCKARLHESRICDGFIDCPMGTDELGCFGCDKFQYSCYENRKDYEDNPSKLMCYSSLEKCDGFSNCYNGKDEAECSMIVQQIGAVNSYFTSHSEGILHRNYKGRWYPVCKNPMKWAVEACENEIGKVNFEPILSIKNGQIAGPFVHSTGRDIEPPAFSDVCRMEKARLGVDENHVVYVKCGQPKCGISKIDAAKFTRNKRDAEDVSHEVQAARIVGGSSALPGEFPFIVAIFKDGRFHCGGSIYNERWILTAAHCTRAFESHHFEVRAGLLRRSSYSPMIQITYVTHIIPHEQYDRSTLRHDIALMRVKDPFKFNKWVRPICLPTKDRTGTKDWIYGPKAGSICTTLGWGAIREKGPDPDELQVVDVPVLSKCKYQTDEESECVCAGEKDGLKDACQGDSGGPLVCRGYTNPSEWYLLGIVSHGEGCARANEPGVYTRTSLYINWIVENTNALKQLPFNTPRESCPGMNCVWGIPKCIPKASKCNAVVDCLGGEDEVNCPLNWMDLMLIGSKNEDKNDTKNDIDPNKTGSGNESKKVSKKELKGEVFRCARIPQTIHIDHRCDRVFDCEDGTDELNCKCKDHLKGPFTKLICDGHVDCADSSDEIDCLNCNKTQYSCPKSKTCISWDKQCDGNLDCKFGEDEMYCVALTDGHSISLDINNKPYLHSKGIVTRNIKSSWKLLCDDNGDFVKNSTALGTDVCSIIGFKSLKSARVIVMPNNDLYMDIDIRKRESHPSAMSMIRSSSRIDRNDIDGCLALEVECSPFKKSNFIDKNSTAPNSGPKLIPISENSTFLKPQNAHIWNHLNDFYFPWTVEINSNGDLVGVGILVDKSWVLAEKSILGTDENPLKLNYVSAIVGSAKSFLKIQSPYEQISKVNCIHQINDSNAMLLHLEKPFHFNRHVLPLFLPITNEIEENDERCLAVAVAGVNKGLKSLDLKIEKNCKDGGGRDCYKVHKDDEKKIKEYCNDSETSHKIATIVCRTKTSDWYPKAFHRMKKGFCDFVNRVSVFDLKSGEIFSEIADIKDSPTCPDCKLKASDFPCPTHRCPFGKCLTASQICNRIPDCHDGSDESQQACDKIKQKKESQCLPLNSFKCRNGKCMEKIKFCDHIDDCGDRTDEPSECTCFEYLNVTNPRKICDGIVHCWDRSDEDVNYCESKCNQGARKKFMCRGSSFCVPYELVCDKKKDCPNGADEKHCWGIYEADGSDFFEVYQQTMGLWHTKCFPKSSPPTQFEIEDICKQLNQKSSNFHPQARLKTSTNTTISELDELKHLQVKFEDAKNATKVALFSKYSPTKVSDTFTAHLKTDKPLAKVVSWNKEDHDNCYRLEIKCN